MASSKRRINKASSLIDGENKLESKDEVVKHIEDFFVSLYSKEVWERLSLDDLNCAKIAGDNAHWLERKFAFVGDKAPGRMISLWPSFSVFWGC